MKEVMKWESSYKMRKEKIIKNFEDCIGHFDEYPENIKNNYSDIIKQKINVFLSFGIITKKEYEQINDKLKEKEL